MLNLNNITKRYGEKVIFKNMNIQFDNTNEINGIIGKSGSGKSTLFNILFGLDTDYEAEQSASCSVIQLSNTCSA